MWSCDNCGCQEIMGIAYCPVCGTERPVAKNTVEGGYSDKEAPLEPDENEQDPESPEGDQDAQEPAEARDEPVQPEAKARRVTRTSESQE